VTTTRSRYKKQLKELTKPDPEPENEAYVALDGRYKDMLEKWEADAAKCPPIMGKDVLNAEQLKDFDEQGPVTDIEEGACQTGNVAVRAMQMSMYMRALNYPSAQRDANAMLYLGQWFNNQEIQAELFKSGTATLMNACNNGQFEIAKALLENLEPNISNDGGETLLMMAAKNGHLDTVDYLLSIKADPTRKAKSGGNILTSAVLYNNERVVKYLLALPDSGIDLDAKYEGVTSVMMCIKRGHQHILERLLDAKADVNLRQSFPQFDDSIAFPKEWDVPPEPAEGMTAMEIAVEEGKHNAVEVLKRRLGTLDLSLEISH